MSEEAEDQGGVSRRAMLRIGAAGAAGVALYSGRAAFAPHLSKQGLLSPDGAFAGTSIAIADQIYIEDFPTSPLILTPFSDVLPIPKALAPVPQSVYSGWAPG